MTFRDTLQAHLEAIRRRDLDALAATLPAEQLLLITSRGGLVRSVLEFLAMHRDWFASSTWTLQAEPVQVLESPELAVAVLHLDYRDRPAGGEPTHERSYLTLVFQRQGDQWVMVQDQNTPIRA
jgi:uncharacterized protein (TIGR02246 family)